MKKLLFAAVFVGMAFGAGALDLIGGIGVSVGAYAWTEYDYYSGSDTTYNYVDTRAPLDLTAIFDATYLVAGFGYSYASGGHYKNDNPSAEGDFKDTRGYITFSLLGKYPFASGSLKVFPVAGVQYDLNVTALNASGADVKAGLTDEQKSYYDRFWLVAGVGADIPLGDKLVIRPQVTLKLKFLNKSETDWIQSMTDAGNTGTLTTTVVGASLILGYKL